jgi:hypothetical protein
MRRQPCVIFRRWDGSLVHVLHGTAMRAQRNAAMTGQEFHWHETETWLDRLRLWAKRKRTA